MNGTDDKAPRARPGPGHETEHDVLADLLRQVPAREPAPAEDEKLIRQAVHREWRGAVRRRRRKTWTWALAASVLVALAAIVRMGFTPPATNPGPMVASVDRISGTVTAHSASGPVSLTPGPERNVAPGLTLRSGPASGAALRWINGALVRMDADTELTLTSEEEIFLLSGRIYLDTSPNGLSSRPLAVQTPLGQVRHVGTQFMARTSASGLLISVREGEVTYRPKPGSGQGVVQAVEGEQLGVSPRGDMELEPISTWGAEWNWAEALSPGFRSDGRSLADLFSWAGRELGRQVEYASLAAEVAAADTLLHGDLEVSPSQALSVATATSDLRAEMNAGRIIVSLSGGP